MKTAKHFSLDQEPTFIEALETKTSPVGSRRDVKESGPTNIDANPFGTYAHDKRKALFAAVEDVAPTSGMRSRRSGKIELPKKARVIGQGGEHLVFAFEDPRHKGFVQKVNFHQTRPVLDAHIQGQIARTQAIERMEAEMIKRRAQLRELREYFGSRAVPVQRFFVQEVPVTREIVDLLYPKVFAAGHEIPATLPAWGSLQRYLDLPKDKTVSLTGYYPESSYNRYHKDQKKRLASIYEPAHDVLIGKSVDHLDPEEERQLILDMYPGLHAVTEKVEDDSTFAAALQSAVKNMIRYTNETRVALDLAGGGNVVLVQGERGWELKMPDPLPLGDFTLEDIVVASRQVRRGDVMDASVTNANVFNALNTVRVINALAILSGLPEEARLRIPELSEVPASAWASIFGVETRKVMKENTVG